MSSPDAKHRHHRQYRDARRRHHLGGGTIDDTGTLSISIASEIENATVNGGGILSAIACRQVLTLDTVTLDNVTLTGVFTDASTVTIDNTVTLDGATISGGTIDDTGTLSVEHRERDRECHR